MPFFRRKADSAASSKHASPASTPSPKTAARSFSYKSPTSPSTPSDTDIGLPVDVLNKRSGNSTPVLARSTSFAENLSGDLGSYCLKTDAPMPATSRLSKTLHEVLNNKDALGYFIQYMEHRAAGRFIRFWLDSESFQAATWTRIRSHSLNAVSHSSVARSPTSPSHTDQTANHVDRKPNCDPKNETLKFNLENEDAIGEKLRKSVEKDAVAIYSRYISKDALKPIGLTDELRDETIRKICCEDGRVDPLCFVECQDHAFQIMDKEYFEPFTRSEFYCQHQIDFLTSGDVKLNDILYNETSMFYFMEYMELEGGSTMLQFLVSVDNFEQLLMKSQGAYDGLQAQGDAMVLYDKYFSLQATTPLGFDDKIRFEVESNICREEGPLPTCFHTARSIVLNYIDRKYFKKFLSSELYFKYLSELINTIQSSQDLVQGRSTRKRQNSDGDASSDHSQGAHSSNSEKTKNTLLATDSSSNSTKRLSNLKADDFRIDMGSIINPQNLWQRDKSRNLNLGHIDSMGHFVSNFDREPDHNKKNDSFFSRKRKDKDKTQEEMALKIAQMIINDVTSITALDDDEAS